MQVCDAFSGSDYADRTDNANHAHDTDKADNTNNVDTTGNADSSHNSNHSDSSRVKCYVLISRGLSARLMDFYVPSRIDRLEGGV